MLYPPGEGLHPDRWQLDGPDQVRGDADSKAVLQQSERLGAPAQLHHHGQAVGILQDLQHLQPHLLGGLLRLCCW